MKDRRIGLLTLSLAGVLAWTGGCTGEPASAPPVFRELTPTAEPATTEPPADPVRNELLQALRRSQGAAYQYTVQGSLPEGASVQGTGKHDPGERVFESTVNITGGKSPSAIQRIVIGQDSYTREPDDQTWVHLDLSRVKQDSLAYFDMGDPTGLVKFSSAIGSVRQTGPHAYAGTFSPESSNILKPFLPVGAPSMIAVFIISAKFTATTDEHGWVTSITVGFEPSNSPPLNMTTTMTGHGTKLQVKAPPKGQVHEAAGFYYEK